MIAWSPCNRFIAVGGRGVVEIRDAVTLMLVNTLEDTSGSNILRFSPDSRLLTEIGNDIQTVVTWDLQTGGLVNTTLPIHSYAIHSSTHSMDGKMFAVAYYDGTLATHDLSTTDTWHLYQVPEGPIVLPIWTRGDFLRFGTVKAGSIIIWEVEFTLTHPPEAVESFPLPVEIPNPDRHTKLLFLPSHSRLAVSLRTLYVWDVRDFKVLLKTNFGASSSSFSSDGRFFACFSGGDFYLWEESPAGYGLYQKFTIDTEMYTQVYLSPNAESIIVYTHSTIQLRHTEYSILPSHLTGEKESRKFILGFSPDYLLAAFSRLDGKKVTILDLQSGDPLLEIDTDMEVEALGVTGSAIVVVSWNTVGTWSLTPGEAGAKFISDIVQKTWLQLSSSPYDGSTLVSPDLSRIVTIRIGAGFSSKCLELEICDASTGMCLTRVQSDIGALKIFSLMTLFINIIEGIYSISLVPWFTPDGRQIWTRFYQKQSIMRGWKIIEDSESGVTEVQPLGPTTPSSGAPPWQPFRGYEVTDDGWILSSTRKKLLWLPHYWRGRDWMWSGRFLGVLHQELPEIVILEFCE